MSNYDLAVRSLSARYEPEEDSEVSGFLLDTEWKTRTEAFVLVGGVLLAVALIVAMF